MQKLTCRLTALALVVAAPAPLYGQGSQLDDIVFNEADGNDDDRLGQSVALSDVDGDGAADLAIVSVPRYDKPGVGDDVGKVLVYTKIGGVWSTDAFEIFASDGEPDDLFGTGIDADALRVVVGARAEDTAGNDAGAVYIYDLTETVPGSYTYTETKLVAFDAEPEARLGQYVAVDGDVVVACAAQDDAQGLADSGAAYVFENVSGAIWSQTKLVAPDAQALDIFGLHAVDVCGNTIVCGAAAADSVSAVDSGAAYVYRRENAASTWDFVDKLEPTTGALDDFYGLAVSIDDDVIVVGAEGVDPQGAAYVYREDPSGPTWNEEIVLTPSNPAFQGFGSGVSVCGSMLAVGAAGGATGFAQVYRWTGKEWLEEDELASSTQGAAAVGHDVDVLGRDAIVSAWATLTAFGVASGEALVFEGITPWVLLDHGIPGTGGTTPVLATVGPLTDGTPISVDLCDVTTPNAFAANLVIGLSYLGAPLKGGILGPTPTIVVTGLPTPGGELLIANTWPSGIPSGFSFWLQYWIVDPGAVKGFSATNTMCGTTP